MDVGDKSEDEHGEGQEGTDDAAEKVGPFSLIWVDGDILVFSKKTTKHQYIFILFLL